MPITVRPLTALYKKLESLSDQNKNSEYKNKRDALLALLNDDTPDSKSDLKHLLRHAVKNKDAQVLEAVLQSIFKHKQEVDLAGVILENLAEISEEKWFREYFNSSNIITFRLAELSKIYAIEDERTQEDDREKSVGSHANRFASSSSSSSSGSVKPNRPAPKPEEEIPLTVLLTHLNKMLENPDYDKSVYNNYRKALLALLRDDIPDKDQDLGNLFKLARQTKDNEIIDAIILPFAYTPIKSGKLFDQILETFVDLQNISWFRSFFTTSPYQRKIEQILQLAFEMRSVQLSDDQLEKMLRMACDNHDYKLVANLLAAPQPEIKDQDFEDPDDSPTRKKRANLIYNILAPKIKEYYASYSNDKKSLFWLVAIKDVIEEEEGLDLNLVDTQKLRDLAQLSLAHNNIQFVETWVQIQPKLLDDVTFAKAALVKYSRALKSLLEDDNARNGFGTQAILDILSSKVLEGKSLKNLFPNQEKLVAILSNTDSNWRTQLVTKLKELQILDANVNLNAQEDELVNACLNGDIKVVQRAIINGQDLAKFKYQKNSLLHYVVSYKYNEDKGGWPHSVLRKAINEQRQDESFQKLSASKNKILELLLAQVNFSKEDIQDAYNKACRDGTVKKDNKNPFKKNVVTDNNLKTEFALRGDHNMMRKLIDVGANPAVGETFVGIWRAVTYSYAASVGVDFVLGTSADLIQHYLKFPARRIYNSVASYISGGTSAATFLATGAVAEAYHRNLNPDYYENNFLDLTQVIAAGNYTKNWLGMVQSGRALESKMGNQAGVSGSENAIYDASDIDSHNRNIHHKVALDIYGDFCRASSEKEKASWYLHKRGLNGLLEQLEAMNHKCDYGIAGDGGYSFNREFQEELRNIFAPDNESRTIDSILSTKRNRAFFLDFARGVEQGLVKVPLIMKKQILEVREKVLKKMERPVSSAPTQDLPFVFGKLRKMFDQHSKDNVPLSVMLVAQHYRQLGISTTARTLKMSEKIWICFRERWQCVIGKVVPVFGLTKEQGNDIVAATLTASATSLVAIGGYYEKKLRDEIADQGFLKSVFYITTICSTAMTTLDYAGIPPFVVIPVMCSVLAFLYCRHKQINPITAIADLSYKAWDSIVPSPDPSGVFINKATREQFDGLCRKIRSQLIPEVVGMSL